MAEVERDKNVLAALTRGTTDGLSLALNVGAMLITFIAMIYLVDGVFGAIHNALALHRIGWFPTSVEQIIGWILAPIAWLIGIPWHDAPVIGNLLGLRMVTNELVAFQRLGPMKDDARSAFLHHRHVRPMRLREFQFHRHSDWRHRCAGSE